MDQVKFQYNQNLYEYYLNKSQYLTIRVQSIPLTEIQAFQPDQISLKTYKQGKEYFQQIIYKKLKMINLVVSLY